MKGLTLAAQRSPDRSTKHSRDLSPRPARRRQACTPPAKSDTSSQGSAAAPKSSRPSQRVSPRAQRYSELLPTCSRPLPAPTPRLPELPPHIWQRILAHLLPVGPGSVWTHGWAGQLSTEETEHEPTTRALFPAGRKAPDSMATLVNAMCTCKSWRTIVSRLIERVAVYPTQPASESRLPADAPPRSNVMTMLPHFVTGLLVVDMRGDDLQHLIRLKHLQVSFRSVVHVQFRVCA